MTSRGSWRWRGWPLGKTSTYWSFARDEGTAWWPCTLETLPRRWPCSIPTATPPIWVSSTTCSPNSVSTSDSISYGHYSLRLPFFVTFNFMSHSLLILPISHFSSSSSYDYSGYGQSSGKVSNFSLFLYFLIYLILKEHGP